MSGRGGDDRPAGGPFTKKRAGVPLSKIEVAEIKAGRAKLKKDMKTAGVYDKQEFETTAATLGLYFDKPDNWLLLFLRGKGLWLLLGAAAALLAAILGMSKISQMRGYFTINLQEDMSKNGFVLSDTADFKQPVSYLFCEPAVDMPCISITSIEETVDDYEGQHNGYGYFAYTFFIRNEGDDTVDYTWDLLVSGESLDVSRATWIMVIEDGQMCLYAEVREDGQVETVPARGVTDYGYLEIPVMALADPKYQFLEIIKQVGPATYQRVVPQPFVSEDMVAQGRQNGVKPMDVHKYTVVVWLEGDDPDCTNDLIGGHLGLSFQFQLVEE